MSAYRRVSSHPWISSLVLCLALLTVTWSISLTFAQVGPGVPAPQAGRLVGYQSLPGVQCLLPVAANLQYGSSFQLAGVSQELAQPRAFGGPAASAAAAAAAAAAGGRCVVAVAYIPGRLRVSPRRGGGLTFGPFSNDVAIACLRFLGNKFFTAEVRFAVFTHRIDHAF